ncbi:MAG: hypothetical protein AB7S74_09450 [Hyphomicrobium sp.]
MNTLMTSMKLSEIEIQREVDRFCRRFGADFPAYRPCERPAASEGARYTYILATTSRTGTSYLAKALEVIGLGKPKEYFNGGLPDSTQFEDTISELLHIGTSDNGCLGIKLGLFDLLPFLKCKNFPFKYEDCRFCYAP